MLRQQSRIAQPAPHAERHILVRLGNRVAYLFGAAGTDQNRGHRRMRERKPQCCRAQRDPVQLTTCIRTARLTRSSGAAA